MIRRGKAQGWLQLPTEALLPWAMLNDVQFTHVVPGVAAGRGAGLLASKPLPPDAEAEPQPLLTVPRDLILSLERVLEHAKVDQDFREVLESLGEFGRVGVPAQSPQSPCLTRPCAAQPARPRGVHCLLFLLSRISEEVLMAM